MALRCDASSHLTIKAAWNIYSTCISIHNQYRASKILKSEAATALRHLTLSIFSRAHGTLGDNDEGSRDNKQGMTTTIIDMNRIIEIKNKNIHSKCGWSPFDGYKFKGSPVYTIINGDIKMKEDEILGDPSGKPILFD